jgi:predicted unusual protein kinase regulating ubiquinone biosynthesis (AarF/ABC1/UbiB family)
MVMLSEPVPDTEARASVPVPTADTDHRRRVLLRFVLRLLAQLPGLLVVDPALALSRRRPLAASVGARVRRVLAGMGPVYDELAQLLASHAVVCPGALFAGFDLGAPSHAPAGWSTVRAAVVDAFGPIDRRFRTLAETPFHTTATAQHHRGVLLDGTEVAVKVRRPGLDGSLALADQALAARLVARVAGWMTPAGVELDRDELAATILAAHVDQLDLRNEAAHLTRFAAIVDAQGIEGIVVPAVVDDLASADVLVTTFVHGRPATTSSALDALVPRAARALFGGARGGLLLGDLRPANLVELADGSLGILGFEDCVELTAEQVKGLNVLFAGIAKRDGRVVVHGLDLFAALGPDTDRRLLAARLERLTRERGDAWRTDPLHGVPMVFEVFRDSGVRAPAALLLLAADALHLQALAAGGGADADLRGQLTASGPLRRPPASSLDAAPTDDEVVAAAPVEWAMPEFSMRAGIRSLPPWLKPRRDHVGDLLPLVTFIVVNIAFGIRWAILAFTALSLQAGVRRKLRGEPISKPMKVGIGIVLVAGAIGMFLQSGIVVFLPQLALNVGLNLALVLSLVVNRPLYGELAYLLWPLPASLRRDRSIERPVFWCCALYSIPHLAFLFVCVWLLFTASPNTYVAVSGLGQHLSAPLSALLLVGIKRVLAKRAPVVHDRLVAAAS